MSRFDLTGKIALVTGASRGIGRAIAWSLAEQGASVIVHYKQAQDAADALVAEIRQRGGQAWTAAADLAAPHGYAGLVTAVKGIVQESGAQRLDILVNNAGISLRARIADIKPDDFDRVLQVNLKTPFFLIQQLLPLLRDGGRIINVSSMGTRAAYPEMSVYAPAKAGLEALTLLLAAELGPRNITVNAVLPGATATDLNERARNPEIARVIAQTIALGRVGQPDDIAGIVAFLASDAARWVTGQRIDATGGQRI
ncbi:glucose 1-dehydrogenase [Herbaspirillum sp. alder98]|uniref:glucose 1-dehydrogenase n=1 Tax=Herbaspirillum sp. alder98 TaxID=2913096 RepID=UPI001CD8D2AB|nr:glucose 1-dehydrogenase [Herbaspirillum sp. alder98]MCA1326100.1 glucose 1-dehydrogenase [Herbaspirillum sp. alder98]